jgi:hypothetical protein
MGSQGTNIMEQIQKRPTLRMTPGQMQNYRPRVHRTTRDHLDVLFDKLASVPKLRKTAVTFSK